MQKLWIGYELHTAFESSQDYGKLQILNDINTH